MPTVFEKIRDLIRGTQRPEPPRARPVFGGGPGGHRGIAMGDAKNPNRSAENVAQWETLDANTAERFLYQGAVLPVHSSNVDLVQFDIDKQMLIVTYKGKNGGQGAQWGYEPYTVDEANSFLQAMSKGSWCWDNIRVRGTKHAHQRNAHRIR